MFVAAMQFSQTMTRLDAAQQQLTDTLKSRGVELKEVNQINYIYTSSKATHQVAA